MAWTVWAVPDVDAGSLLRFHEGAGSVGIGFDSAWRGADGSSVTRNGSLRQWITVPFSGEVVDPRILGYRFTLRPVFLRQDVTGLPEAIDTRDFSASASASILTALPLSGHAHWERNDVTTEGGYGTRSTATSTGGGGVLTLRSAWVPLSMSYTERRGEGSSRVGLDMVPIEHSYDVRSFRFTASTGKLSVVAAETRFDDRVHEADYVNRELRGEHVLRWGKGSRIQSGYDRQERGGVTEQVRDTWRERLRIAHTATTTSTARLERTRVETAGDLVQSQVLTGDFECRAWSAATVGVAGASRTFRSRSGRQESRSVAPRLGFRTRVPGSGRLSGSASVGYQVRRDRATDSEITVLNEPLRFDDEGSIRLDNADIVPDSFVLRSSDETTTYVEGLDYRIATIGGVVEIRVVAGGRLRPGDEVLVTYRTRVNPVAREEAWLTRYSVAWATRGITVRHARTRRDSDTDAPLPARPIQDSDQYSTTVRAVRDAGPGRLEVELGRHRRESATLRYVTHEVRASFGRSVGDRAHMRLEASGRQSEEAGVKVRSGAITPAGTWSPRRGLDVRGSLAFRYWKTPFEVAERVWRADLAVAWRHRALEMDARVSHDRTVFERRAAGTTLSTRITRRI